MTMTAPSDHTPSGQQAVEQSDAERYGPSFDRALMGTPQAADAELARLSAEYRDLRKPFMGSAKAIKQRQLREREVLFNLGHAALLWLWHREDAAPTAPSTAAWDLRECLSRVTDHLETWANDHSDERTSDIDAAIYCARKALTTAPSTAAADTARLDFLDQCNGRLNAKFGTNYHWKLILNHNVSRLMLGHLEVDLNDAEARGLPSCRDAIDEKMRECGTPVSANVPSTAAGEDDSNG